VKRPWLRAAGFAAAALATVVAACEAPGPVQPAPASVTVQPVRTGTVRALVTIPSNARISRAAIESAVRENYPEVFRATAGETAMLMFVLAPDGSIERHERLQMKRTRSDAPDAAQLQELAQATGLRERSPGESAIMDVVTFAPGQMGPGRVEVVWARKLSPDQLTTTTETTRERVPAGERPFR
jgi:hypothetical protein